MATSAISAASLNGQVLGAGAPIANSTVTLWAASAGAPKQLAQARSGADGSFTLTAPSALADSSLYLVAQGGQPTASKAAGNNPAIALISVLGNKPPLKVTINEMTTVASVWTNNQFLHGTAISGSALGLHIAAGNVPNLVDLETDGLHHAGPRRRVQQALRSRHASGWRCAHRHAHGGAEHRAQLLASGAESLRAA